MKEKIHTYHELVTIIGIVNTFVIWNLWNEVLIIVSGVGLGEAIPIIFGLFVGILIQVSLVGLTGIFTTSKKMVFAIAIIWSLPLLQHNQLLGVGVLWMVLYAVLSFWVMWGVRRQNELFIKPYLIKVIPGQVKIWFFLFTIILSGSLIVHPAVQQSNFSIEIPEGIWEQIWGLVDIEYQTSTPTVSDVQSAQDIVAQGNQVENSTLDSFRNLLQKYGLINAGDELPRSAEDFDAGSYLNDFEEGVSQDIKNNTENLVNNYIDPIRNYLPYLIGLSFFLSAQIITPILGYLTFFTIEGMLFIMRKMNIIALEEKETTVKRYVLQ